MPRLHSAALGLALAPGAALAMAPYTFPMLRTTTLPALVGPDGYCSASPQMDCSMMMCPAVLPQCASTQCAYRTGCCSQYECVSLQNAAAGIFPIPDQPAPTTTTAVRDTTTNAAAEEVEDADGFCSASPQFYCKMMCPDYSIPACDDDECLFRSGCCNYACVSHDDAAAGNFPVLTTSTAVPTTTATVADSTGPPGFCPDSPAQQCRMTCPDTNCPDGACAMRQGTCCDYSCLDADGNEVKPLPPSTTTTRAAKLPYAQSDGFCNTSPQMLCDMYCPAASDKNTCGKAECAMRADSCSCVWECVEADNSQINPCNWWNCDGVDDPVLIEEPMEDIPMELN